MNRINSQRCHSQPVEEGFAEDVAGTFDGGDRARQPQDPDDEDDDADAADAPETMTMIHVPGSRQRRHVRSRRGVR